jgi:aminoglycoside phosphotransferase (APT) family kinase protein
MIAPSALDLARRDPGIPGLATVLDPDAFLLALRRAARRADLVSPRICSVRLEPHEYCRVAYRLDLGGRTLDLDVRACRPGDLSPWFDEEASAGDPGPLGARHIVLEDDAVVVTAFPNDRKLPALRLLSDPAELERLLREVLPDRPDLWSGELTCLRYRAGRRFVAGLCGAGGRRAVLKLNTSKGFKRSLRSAMAFRPDRTLRVARVLGADEELRLIVYEWMAGTMLFDLCAGPQMDLNAVAAAATALAELHRQDPPGLGRWAREARRADLSAAASEIGFLCPWFARQALDLAARLSEGLAEAPALDVPLHGDFSSRHVLVDGSSAAIIDLDLAYRGDPADDLGGILAQVERHAICGELPRARAVSFREAFLLAYRNATGKPLPERIGLYRAIELFRGARFPFRKYEAEWQQQTRLLIHQADSVLSRSESR